MSGCIDESVKPMLLHECLKRLLQKIFMLTQLESFITRCPLHLTLKLLSVRDDPNKQKHLDVMCFPVLFPTGEFGEFHPREVKLSHTEYIKSRLLNKESRFRKYVSYLLWQKEMRQLSVEDY